VSTSAPTTTEQPSQTSYKPSERRVALSSPVAEDTPEADTQAQVPTSTTQQSQARRSFAPTTTTETPVQEPQEPQEPSTDEDGDWDGSQPAEEQPTATPKPAAPQAPAKIETEKVVASQPVARPDAQPQEQPAAQPEPEQPATTQQPQQPQADPCPPAADPCPPAAEQAPAPAADTAAPKPPC
jgi:hypothetical protein